MDFLTRIDPTRPINRALRGAGRNAAEGVKEELIEATDYLFDRKVAPLTYMINCRVAERIKQAKDAGEDLVDYMVDSISVIEAELKGDIEDLLTNVDQKYKDNLRRTFEEVNQARAEAIADLRKTIKAVDKSLEERINQLFLALMIVLTKVEQISDKFTPGAFRKQLIEPTFKELNTLEKELYQDLDTILDQVAQVTDFTLNEFQNRVLNKLDFIDPRFGIGKKNLFGIITASSLNDLETYRYLCAVELDKIAQYVLKNDLISKIFDSYIQLQIIASRMNFKARVLGIEALKDSCLQDWVKYGLAIKLWKVYLA